MRAERIRNKMVRSDEDNMLLVTNDGRKLALDQRMLSGGDIKGVQGDTGHAQATMVTERYAHILDDNRRVNAERFQQQFYSSPVSEEPAKQPDSIQELDAGGKQALLLKLLAESPEMASMIKSLAKVM